LLTHYELVALVRKGEVVAGSRLAVLTVAISALVVRRRASVLDCSQGRRFQIAQVSGAGIDRAQHHLVAAEKRLGEIVAGMGNAETQLAIAREGYAGAAERVQQAVAEREQALWPAAIEAAGDVLREMERAVATVLSCEDWGSRAVASAAGIYPVGDFVSTVVALISTATYLLSNGQQQRERSEAGYLCQQ